MSCKVLVPRYLGTVGVLQIFGKVGDQAFIFIVVNFVDFGTGSRRGKSFGIWIKKFN
jgi:hypothetical protein